MRTFASYIEYLLMTQHYAFVPAIGGFMMKEVPSRIEPIQNAEGSNSRSFRLVPPMREVAFNRLMSYDDGMLVNAYMHVENATFDEASRWVRQETQNVLAILSMHKPFEIGKLGHLYLDEDNQILFASNTETYSVCDVDHFGFDSLRFTTIFASDDKQQDVFVPSDTIIIPIRKSWLRYVAMFIIVVCCFFGNYVSPDSSATMHSHYATMMDHDLLVGKRRPNIQAEHIWEVSSVDEVDSVANVMVPITDSIGVADAAPCVSSPAELAASDIAAADAIRNARPENKKSYYIIVASCNSMHEAESHLERLKKLGYENIGLIEKDNRFRLYIRDFEVKDDAMSYLDEIRKESLFFDAWLLPARSNSISIIIKTHINEQLSMELSRFTRRTETDQGEPDYRA